MLPGVKIYIIQTKLASPAISRLFKLVENHAGKLCKNVDEADVVITAIRMRKRLERHVPPDMIVSYFKTLQALLSYSLEIEENSDTRMA